jgi:hypothetical protein
MTMARYDAPVIVDPTDAQQLAARELAKPQYHDSRYQGGGTLTKVPTPVATTAVPSSPPASPPARSHQSAGTILLVIAASIVLVIALILALRRIGRPRTAKKSKKGAKRHTATTPEAALTGAARHRRDAELAAAAEQWADAIRERFRAVIATLDERGLLPDQAHRTADEAAASAGALLPAHGPALIAAARGFDEVEYGEYLGSATAYAVIVAADESASNARPGALPAVGAAVSSGPGTQGDS